MTTVADSEPPLRPYKPCYNPFPSEPVLVKQSNDHDGHTFIRRPLLGLLLFDNINSDARDHCANERTFLSWLRLSIYMAIVSVAIMVSFHLKSQPTAVERRVALPFGIIFWLLSLACLASGFANYVQTLTKYSQRMALVQSGWKTQMVFTVVATAIIAACVLFLSADVRAR